MKSTSGRLLLSLTIPERDPYDVSTTDPLKYVMALPLSLFAQTLAGRVSSEGTPLVDATVLVKGTATGTATDANGRPNLALSAVFSEKLKNPAVF